ncbi:SPOR domain-containing protein [Pigmentiphaga sp. CHJ604]|uniref:SPOR domain-containing protein n=1 Tax=Pigmentiphaga sp. CHJ604 TaxID=3081984 RepID=UPI0030D57270
MRSLFVVLLLANVALFALDRGWFGQPFSERGRDPARMRSELRADTIQVPRLPGINATDEAPPAPAAEPAQSSPAAPDAEPSAGAADIDAAPGSAAQTTPPAGAVIPAAATANAEPAPAIPPTVPPAAAPASPPAPPEPLACVEWGAFSEADLIIARKWANDHLPAAKQGTRREPGKQGWMVIVPPLPSASAAQAAAAQLGKNGVKDYFVIQEGGPLQHAISLGVFSTEAAAKKQATILQGQGVRNAKVVARGAQGGKSWLRLDGVAAAGRRAIEGARNLFDRPTVRDCL